MLIDEVHRRVGCSAAASAKLSGEGAGSSGRARRNTWSTARRWLRIFRYWRGDDRRDTGSCPEPWCKSLAFVAVTGG